MILVDTSVWIDHFRAADPAMARLLNAGRVIIHPFVIGELAVGNLHSRRDILRTLSILPEAEVATDIEVLYLIEQYSLFGRGIGYVDAHLLSSVRLTPETTFWTRDRRRLAAARQMDVTIH